MTSEESRGPRRLRRLGERNEGIVELVACCPNLQRLSFTPFRHAHIVKVAEDIEEYGLKDLRLLTVKNEARILDGVQCAMLLQSCMEASKEPTTPTKTTAGTPRHGGGGVKGLFKINISPERLENEARLVSRIVLHADTLRSLKLTLCGAFEVMPENLLPQILYQCHKLEVLGPSFGTWACRRLRKFAFTTIEHLLPELENEEDEEDEDEHGVNDSTAIGNWFRNWKNRKNKSYRATDTLSGLRSISSTHPVMG
ncbi:hypothetical protein BGZ96_006840 [Linnemannia gamsii]|uniref:F-box domain-containing protein n=1 Tax=Linnemannia gamsii TaxID=64522 RepID=A0ABQ7K1M5_9FUNG|nr:hypothetical protein BGZ96_006840 [Linnemannia gamsii]